jgi:hypothetical protein
MAAAELFEATIEKQWQMYRTFDGDMRSLPSWDGRAVYFMLAAFSVENLLKGALVFANVPTNGIMYFRTYSPLYGEISQGDLPGILKTHDLNELAERLGLQLSPEEEDLLFRLTRAAEWHGRYPVPVRYEDLQGERTFADGKRYNIRYSSGDDVERVKRLVTTLGEGLGRTPKSPPAEKPSQEMTAESGDGDKGSEEVGEPGNAP